MKYLWLLFLFVNFEISLFSQEWKISNNLPGNQINPQYSLLENDKNTYIFADFLDTIYKPIRIVSVGRRDLVLYKLNNQGDIIWNKQFGGDSIELCGGIANNSSGDIFVTGGFSKTCNFSDGQSLASSGDLDIFLAKLSSSSGLLNWVKKIGWGNNYQLTSDIIVDETSIIITGFYTGTLYLGNPPSNIDTLLGSSTYSGFLAKLDLNGNLLWSRNYPSTSNNTSFKKVGIAEDGYYVGGSYQGSLTLDIGTLNSTSNSLDMFLYKTDFNGNGIWIRTFRGNATESFRSLKTDEYDNAYVLGSYSSLQLTIDSTEFLQKVYGNTGGYDAFIAKYNRSGVLQWFKSKGSSSNDYFFDIAIKNNIIYTSGYFANQIIFNNDTLRSSSILNKDAFLGVFNQNGDPITGISINGTGNYEDAATNVSIDNSSQAYIVGRFKSPNITIGNKVYNNTHTNKNDIFFAIYKHPFKAVITDESMVSCNGLSDGMLTVTPYFGRPPYTYSWSHNPSLNSPIAENLAAGDYTVTVTDANDSTTSITGHISQSPALDITGVITPVSCYNGSDGGINITPTGGSGGYNFYWTSLNGSGIQPLIEDQSGLTKGTYSVRVIDKNLCKDSTGFIVTEPDKFSYKGTVTTKIIIPPGNNGAINLKPAGGNYPYTFVWTGPNGYVAYSEDIGNLADAGLYNLSLTDAKSCKSDTTFTVIDNFTFVAEISAKTDVTCYGANDGTATVRVLNGTAPFSYEWSDDGISRSDSVRTGMQPGHYIVYVTDGALKTSQASVDITQPSMPLSIVLDADDLTCYNDNSGVIELTVSGGLLPYSYSWNNGYTGEDLVNVQAGNYTVNVKDAANCQVQGTKEVLQPVQIGLTIALDRPILCHGENTANAIANATGGTPPGNFDYLWDDPGDQVTQTAYNLRAGTYHCTVTDSNKCSLTSSIIILEPDTLTMDVVMNKPSCPGSEDGSIIVTPVGGIGPGYEYVWSNGVFQRLNTDIAAGTYVLTLNDDNNCTIVDTFDLTDPDTLKITSVQITDVSCLGKTDGSAEILATGGTGSIEYSTDNGSTFGNQSIAGNLSAGDYTIVVRDEKDCLSQSQLITITVADTVTIDSIRFVDATCAGLNDGSITLYAGGGAGPYEYSNDGGTSFETSGEFANLPAGDYTMMVRDQNDCRSEEAPVILANTDTVRIALLASTDLTCSGTPDGTITITASGGTRDYTFSTDGGDSFTADSAIAGLAQGDYTVIVKDANNCLSEEGQVTLHTTDVCGLIIYDAFSPNDDSKNDVWNIQNAGSFPNIIVKIFNIWGKEVFNSKGYGTPWDGTWDGKDLPSGTYYYIIDPGDGSDVITGDVSIVK